MSCLLVLMIRAEDDWSVVVDDWGVDGGERKGGRASAGAQSTRPNIITKSVPRDQAQITWLVFLSFPGRKTGRAYS